MEERHMNAKEGRVAKKGRRAEEHQGTNVGLVVAVEVMRLRIDERELER